MRKQLFALAILGLGLITMSPTAKAILIDGEITFAGLWAPTGGATAGTATGISFVNFQVVLDGLGDYAGLGGTTVGFQDFSFAPFSGPVVPLWAFTSGGLSYAFALDNASVTFQDSTQLGLRGTGSLVITDAATDELVRDVTPATWDFTGNQGSKLFSFSADNVAVPEPTTLGLVALGLVGLASSGSKRNRSVA